MIRAHQPGSQPIDIPDVIPNPVVPQPMPAPSPLPKEPIKAPTGMRQPPRATAEFGAAPHPPPSRRWVNLTARRT